MMRNHWWAFEYKVNETLCIDVSRSRKRAREKAKDMRGYRTYVRGPFKVIRAR